MSDGINERGAGGDAPTISNAESQIMEALWNRAPLTAEEIKAEVQTPQGWSDGTVKSLLNRLLQKGAMAARREGRRYYYSPVLSREDYLNHESRGLLDRLFGGQVSTLVSHFSETEQLSSDDISELKKLIEKLDNENTGTQS